VLVNALVTRLISPSIFEPFKEIPALIRSFIITQADIQPVSAIVITFGVPPFQSLPEPPLLLEFSSFPIFGVWDDIIGDKYSLQRIDPRRHSKASDIVERLPFCIRKVQQGMPQDVRLDLHQFPIRFEVGIRVVPLVEIAWRQAIVRDL